MNVVPSSSRAPLANAVSSHAAIGWLSTLGVLFTPNTPVPAPSGLR